MNTLLIVDPHAMPGPYLNRESGVLLAFNGEIYNYRQQAVAWGIPLADRESDAHFLLQAWAKIGPSCLDGLDGMFALAVYDPRAGQLFLARDRLGEKPLYWRLDGGRLTFASEVTTLTGYGTAPLVLRPEMVAIETPVGVDTPFQGIQLLAPATLLSFDVGTGSLDQRTWWRLEDRQPFTGTYQEALARFSVVLAEQVPLRTPSCDFALLLSGGLDSSVLAYLMRPPVCFTVRYRGPVRLDPGQVAFVPVYPDIGGQHAGQVDVPVLAGLADPAGERSSRDAPTGFGAAAAIDMDPGIGRVPEHVLDHDSAGAAPDQLALLRSLPGPDAELDAVLDQEPQHPVDQREFIEKIEDQADHGLHLLVRILDDLTVREPEIADRQGHSEFAAAGLADPAVPHPLFDQMQLGLADGALQPEEHPVVVLSRVIDAVRVGEEGPGQGTQFQELVPFAAAAGQPGHLHSEDQAHVVQTDFGDQPLEAGPVHQARCRLPRSSSITRTRDGAQPRSTARWVSPYCSRVDSAWSMTC